MDTFFEIGVRRDSFARDHHVPHAMQLVDTLLQEFVYLRRRLYSPVINIDQQRFNLMAQVAHGGDACHACAAFQCMQMALEGFKVIAVIAICLPFSQRLVGRFEQLGGLFGEDRSDFCVVGDFFGFFFPGRFRYRFRRRFNRHYLGLHGLRQIADVLNQHCKIGAISIGLIDVGNNRFERFRRGFDRRNTGFLETDLVIVYAPDELVQRAGYGYPAIDIGHIRAAVQRVTGTVQLVRHVKGRPVPGASLYVVVNGLEVTRRFLGKNIEQHGIHFERRGLFGLNFGLGHCNLENGRIGIALRESAGPGHQQADF